MTGLKRIFGAAAIMLGSFYSPQLIAQNTADNHPPREGSGNHATWWAGYAGMEGFGKTTFVGTEEIRTTHSLQAAGYGFRHYLGRNDHSFETWAFGGRVTSHDRDNITAEVKNAALGTTVIYNWPSSRHLPNGFVLGEYVRIFNRNALADGHSLATPEEKSGYLLGKLANFARVRVGAQAFSAHKGRFEASVFPFVTGQMAFGKPYSTAKQTRGYSGEGGLQFNFALMSKRNHLPLVEFQAQVSMEKSFSQKDHELSPRGKAFYPTTAFYLNVSPSQVFAKKHAGIRH